MAFISAIVSSASRTFVWSSRICPLRRSVGGLPTARCRSLAFFFTTVSRRRSIWIVAIGVSSVVRCQLSVAGLAGPDRPKVGIQPRREFFDQRSQLANLRVRQQVPPVSSPKQVLSLVE